MDDFYLTSNAALLLSNARAMQPKEGENENLGGISKSTLKALIGQFLGLLIGCILCGVISLLCK